MSPQALRAIIEAAFEQRHVLTPANVDAGLAAVIDAAVELLDSGAQRIAERTAGHWQVNEWLKKAVLLYFRTHDNQTIEAGYTRFYDKVPLKYARSGEADFAAGGVRVVPH